jgi:glucose-1-phosphate adenylyltransferase
MDILGPEPLIDLDEWGIRTNLEHRGISDCQPLKVGSAAVLENSLAYNGCVVEGHVENSILFPGVHVGKGAVVRNSVIFFNTIVGEGAQLDKVVSDVNVTIGRHARIGEPGPVDDREVTVVGWKNVIPEGRVIGSDCTLYPALRSERLDRDIRTGEVIK